MFASTSSLKSVIISGNLNRKNSIVYKFCPNSGEFSQGLWNIAIPSISFTCNVPNVKEICQFSCNLVKSQRWNSDNEIESYEEPFGMFLLQTGTKIVNFEKHWFKPNSNSNELIINFRNVTEDLLNLDCFVSVFLLFQKIY
jgi:hypothetical protein